MDKLRIQADFNEFLERDLALLSKTDERLAGQSPHMEASTVEVKPDSY